ncbi:MAG: Crp/Fnr family transcriptional regulator [Cyanobacteriota bacterium]|nr:Crp/Fnr family transcriptional regulator [Cyanobacteriota bacterium]
MPALPSLQPADLAAVALFAGLGPEQLSSLLQQHRVMGLAADQQLVLEQDESQGLFLLCSGLAKVRSYSHEGDEIALAVLGPGDLCGEMATLDAQGRRSADVVTLVPCALAVLRAAPFAALLRSEPLLALGLARLQARRLQALNRRYGLRGSDATTRLLAALADLACHSAPNAAPTASIPALPQRELALLAGLARETASRCLSKLRQRGMVVDTDDGGLRLVDLEPLRRRGLL